MKAFARDFGIVLLLTLALLFAAVLHGCAPGQVGPTRAGVPAEAVVELVRQETHPRPTWGAEPGWADLAPRWVSYCHAFGVERLGRVQLATAAHCVVPESSATRYQRAVGLGTARFSYYSEARDVAYLDTDEPVTALPRALALGEFPADGTAVRVFSSSGASSGLVTGPYVLGYYGTTLTIHKGWSGSPVVDARGRAVGIAVKCQAEPYADCMPGSAIVAALP